MGKIKIRFIQENDANRLFSLVDISREILREFLPWVSKMQKLEDEQTFIKNARKELQIGTMYPFVIEKDNQIVGMIDLHNVDRNNKHADIGYWLSSNFVGFGIMQQAIKQLQVYSFENLKLHKLIIRVEPNNKRSINVAQNAGFEFEGTLKDNLYIDGKYHTLNIYSLINR